MFVRCYCRPNNNVLIVDDVVSLVGSKSGIDIVVASCRGRRSLGRDGIVVTIITATTINTIIGIDNNIIVITISITIN